MIALVKWTLGIVVIMMTYMVMLTAVANASVTSYVEIIVPLII